MSARITSTEPCILRVIAGPHSKSYEVSINADGSINRVTFVHAVLGRRAVQLDSKTGKNAINAAREALKGQP